VEEFGLVSVAGGCGLLFWGLRTLIALLVDMHRQTEDTIVDQVGQLSETVVWSGEGHQTTHDLLEELLRRNPLPRADWPYTPTGYHCGGS